MSSNLALVEDCVQEARQRFEMVAIDKGVNFEREAAFSIQALMQNDFTMGVALRNPQSVINAVANISAIGLSLNPARKQAYLVPRDGKICLDVSYMGLLDLAIQDGGIMWGHAELVYKLDVFRLNGVDKAPDHERDPFAEDRGEIVGAYVVVKTPAGDYLTECMKVAELLAIRDRSQAWKTKQAGPWKTDPGEMMKKTVIKRASKTWPKSDKGDRLERAIHHLNTENEEGVEPIDNEPLDQPRNFGLTPARAKHVRECAGKAIQFFNENNPQATYDAVKDITEEDEMQALWSILKVHSAVRTSIKATAKAARAAAEAAEKDGAELTEVYEMKKAFGEAA